MNIDGLNLGPPLRGGTSDVGSTRGRPNKGPISEERSERKPDSFADVLESRDAKPAVPKENASVKVQTTENGSRRADSKEEPAVKAQVVEKLDKPKAKKEAGGAREKAMQEFMDSMESEFGISPQRMVAAMAQLPQEKMLQNPTETASQVIASLNLPPEQAVKAMKMYTGLLQQLSQLPKSQPTVLDQMSEDQRQSYVNQELLKMNDQSSGKDRKLREGAAASLLAQDGQKGIKSDPSIKGQAKPQMFESKADLNKKETGADLKAEFAAMAAGQRPEASTKAERQDKAGFFSAAGALTQSGSAASAAGPAVSEAPPPELMAKLSQLGISSSELNQALQKMPTGAKVVSVDQAGPQAPTLDSKGFSLGLGGVFGKGASGQGSDSGAFAGDDSANDSDSPGSQSPMSSSEGLAQGLRPNSLSHDKPLGFSQTLQSAGGAGAVGSNQRADAAQANIDKLMSQTNMIVRKGGGEATIRMTPEGMGEVQLKVMVKDGKVNIEMSTETKEAKRMIESSMADLKLSLGQHKLSVENVKVDVGLSNGRDHSQQQKGFDMNRDQSRENASQMFQQFREENADRREPFFEMPGIKAYQRPNAGPKPLQAAPEKVASARVLEGRGERMNLVA